ncbi:MAG TPA: FAD-dependent oxidoreductase [Acidimicrobiales bacterium]|nr:FAD-dependent oxidoreductase [Acidimicrobiales bacterium]
MPVATYDAIVIGAGVMGCSVAHALGSTGRSVAVVERGPTAACGSTSASSAIVRFNYSTEVGVATAWESKHLWEAWSEHLGARDDAPLARFIRTGGLALDTPRQDQARVAALFERLGVPYELWDAATIRRRLPAVDPRSYYPPRDVADERFWEDPTGELGGIWTPDAGFVDDPQLAAHNLMAAARARGATFLFGSAVTSIATAGGRAAGIGLAGGSALSAPVVVNAAGPHSGMVNKMAGVGDDFTVSTRPLRQEVHVVPDTPGFNATGPGPFVADLDLGTYFRGTPSGTLLVGGTEPECDPLDWLEDADDFSVEPTQAVYQAQLYRVARRMPELGVPSAPKGVAAAYDVSDDWIPIYDRTALAGYYVAIGTSGNQFKNAPLVGTYLAAIIEACESGADHDLQPTRVRLPVTGVEVDLSHYSRKRPVNRESSFSVMG